MNIKLSNGAELSCLLVTGGQKYVQGQSRDTLAFIFPGDADMAALDEAFTSTNCEDITITGEDETAYIHHGYTIRASLSKEPMEVEPATAETPAVIEDRVKVEMSQRTYVETQLAALGVLMGEGV